jgi:hypothetical protein
MEGTRGVGMTMWLVVRSWAVEAETAVGALEKAKPGEHTKALAMAREPEVDAVKITFVMPPPPKGIAVDYPQD